MRWRHYYSGLVALSFALTACGPQATESSAGSGGTSDGSGGFKPAGSDSTDGTDLSDSSDGLDATDLTDGTDTGVDGTDGTGTDGLDGTDGDVTDKEDVTESTDPPPPPPKSKDQDEDGIEDKKDNCVFDENPEQEDMDADGLGDICDSDLDGDGLPNDSDCEAADPEIFPGNPEKCNGYDDNCDDLIDSPGSEGCKKYYTDLDGDGSGLSTTVVCLCEKENEDQVLHGGDCDDTKPELNPWAVEICNDVDENCNLLIDDGCDDDGDGFCDDAHDLVGNPAICPAGGGDCFDWSAAVNPAAIEIAADGLDNDCDGTMKGEPTGKIEPDCAGLPCTGDNVSAMLCAMELCYEKDGWLTSKSMFSPSGDALTGAYGAIAHYGAAGNDLSPYKGVSYGVISSGQYKSGGPNAANPQGGQNLAGGAPVADPFAKDGYKINDAVAMKVTMKAPPGVTGFTIDYIFMSAEYEEWIGSSFNDKFYILLKAPITTGGAETVINFTGCSNPTAYSDFTLDGKKWCYIAINTAFSEPCSSPTTSIAGTGYQCTTGSSTGWLQTSWPIEPDEVFELTFRVHDASDNAWDSLTILDNFRWEGGTFTQGTASHN